MKRLEEYLDSNDLSIDKFAVEAGVSRQTVYNVLNGMHDQTMSVIRRINSGTKGYITMEHWG